ncbi:MAG: phosphoglycerate kinase [Alphaproteobacteria bacterium]|nr:phosphoglycerate kinase [Alphaproteobacteria bacterium]
MARFRTLDDLAVAGKRVLVRVDFNVPMRDGRVREPSRIERTLPTIRELREKGARVILLSHLGRPDGKYDPALSQKPFADLLATLLGRPVAFAADCIGPPAERVVAALPAGGVALLENVRFHAGEEANDRGFAQELARLGDLYVNDAFAVSHRAHASMAGLAHLLPAAAGRLMQAELDALDGALDNPARPVGAVVGGAKVSSKLAILENLVGRVDALFIGGGMANTFLHALGNDVGRSLCEKGLAETARRIAAVARDAGCALVLPADGVVAAAFRAGEPTTVVPVTKVPAEAMILDVGPATVADMIRRLDGLKTLVWNGPLGAFEVPPFDAGTNAVARAAAARTRAGQLLSVAGGGDTVAALAHAGVVDDFSYVSTAGGAFLEWLEGRALPGVAALSTE